QSYVLYFLKSKDLRSIVLPLGDMIKDEVKQVAREMGLFKEILESQDICFIPDNDYIAYFKQNTNYKPVGGVFEFVDGRMLGHYDDFNAYTIGQRKRLGIAYSEPLYVVRKNREEAKIVVGRQEDLFVSTIELDSCFWNLVDKDACYLENVEVRCRYHQKEFVADIELSGKQATVQLQEPQPAIAPGQTLVAYSGPRVLGGGKILKAI
ncbi:MAG: tRNA 2-thiouridine(34) synthase MnmA, partial [Eggerthellaceae bacterium]|nr:tRNA 2-thiouridine(34) synthase MnmA [Eggerthellaceae bacterium]